MEFISFAILGIIITFANSSWNGFELLDNPIVNTFGNANLCVFFDDPPFSYIGAALWCPLTCTMSCYLYIDLCRVYARMKSKDPECCNITPRFYWWYRAVSIFVGIANFYWVEVWTNPLKCCWTFIVKDSNRPHVYNMFIFVYCHLGLCSSTNAEPATSLDSVWSMDVGYVRDGRPALYLHVENWCG